MRLSTGLVQAILGKFGMQACISNFVCDIYSGTQPTLPDSVPNGTLLVSITKSSGALTAEVRATGSVTLTGGGSGSVNTVTVNGIDILGTAVNFDTSLSATATLVAAQINRNPKNLLYVASASGAVVTLTAAPGLQTLVNTHAVSATLTTITATYVNIGSGVAGVDAVNGLQWIPPQGTALNINKPSADTWSGTAAATGTAGWFRLRAQNDAGTASSTTALRVDGTIGTSGSDMNLPSLAVVATSPFSVPDGAINLPQS